MKKLTAIALALVLTAALFVGCGSRSPVEQQAWNPTGAPNAFGWVVPDETLHIVYYVAASLDPVAFADDIHGGRAHIDAWLLENMNVRIERISSLIDPTERLNQMLASNDYPGVIVNIPDHLANTFISQGRAVDVTEYWDSHLPNLARRVGPYVNLIREDDGKLFKLPHGWGVTPNIPGWDFGIRYDMFMETGLPMYSTPEEYYEALKAVLALHDTDAQGHPVNANGQRVYAISELNDAGRSGVFWLRAMLGAHGFVGGGLGGGEMYRHNDDDTFTYWLRTEEGREISRLMNRMWREGMIDPDYMSTNYEAYISKLATGQVIGSLGTWWHAWVGGHETWAVEHENWTPEMTFMNASIHGEGMTKADTRLLSYNFIGSNRTIITDRCDNIMGVLAFMDWQSTELGNMIMGWGPPGPTNVWWICEDTGIWTVQDEIMDIATKNIHFHEYRRTHGANIYNFVYNVNWLQTDGRSNFDLIDPRITRVSVFDYWPIVPETGEFADPGINIRWGNYTAPAFNSAPYAVSFDPEARVTQVNQTIFDTLPVWWARIVTASSEEAAMAEFDRALAEAEAFGLASLEEFRAEQYQVYLNRMYR